MALIEYLIKGNQYDMYLNRRALVQMRAGHRTRMVTVIPGNP